MGTSNEESSALDWFVTCGIAIGCLLAGFLVCIGASFTGMSFAKSSYFIGGVGAISMFTWLSLRRRYLDNRAGEHTAP